MLLSKNEILNHLENNSITIDPFNEANLGSAQYDVTLGPTFYRERPIDSRRFAGSVIRNKIHNPYSEADKETTWQIEEAISHHAMQFLPPLEGIGENEKIILIHPGEIILAHTLEFIGGSSDNITTMMKARSSVGRNFIEVCRCAGMGDVGFFNRWTMEIANTSRHHIVPLVVGRRVAQIVFFKVDPVDQKDIYTNSGKYQQYTKLADLKKNWSPEAMLPKQWNDREVRALKGL